jgi:hypothetical protein
MVNNDWCILTASSLEISLPALLLQAGIETCTNRRMKGKTILWDMLVGI